MNSTNFLNLINEITGRDFMINTSCENLGTETEYFIYRVLPASGRKVGFSWVTPKTNDKFLRSFITAFTSKYKEPNPANYTGIYFGTYTPKHDWQNMPATEREFCYMHHTSNMFSKTALLEQIEANFSKENITETLCKYGFYTTEYGIGIFCYFNTDGVINSVAKMTKYLKSKSIPFKNEYSDAKWVFRFVLNLDKPKHELILNQFKTRK